MKKYKTLMGTPTDKTPSKERQYHIDAYKKTSKSKAIKKMKYGVGGKFGHDMDKRKAKLDYDEFIVE